MYNKIVMESIKYILFRYRYIISLLIMWFVTIFLMQMWIIELKKKRYVLLTIKLNLIHHFIRLYSIWYKHETFIHLSHDTILRQFTVMHNFN